MIYRIVGLLLLLSSGCTSSIFAQDSDTDRIEIPIRSEKDFFNVINLGNNGALMLYGSGRSSLGAVFYDTNFVQRWSNQLSVDARSQYIDSYDEDGVVYLLFGNDSRRAFELIRVSVNIGLVQQYAFNSLPNFEISHFKVKDEMAYLGGVIKKEPVILTITIGDRTPRVITGGFRERANLQSLEFLDNGNMLASYVLNKRRGNTIAVKEITTNGKIIDQRSVEAKKGCTFINGKIFKLDTDRQLLIGNYGTGVTSNGLPVSQGIYIVRGINLPVPQQETSYYPFTEFSSFFNFMSERRQDKIEKLAKRKQQRGGELRLDYKLLVHDLQKDENGFLLVADVFKPIIRTNNFNSFGMSPFNSFYNPFYTSPFFYSRYTMMNAWAWNPWMMGGNSNTMIDGFDYTHAFMVYFGNDGEVKWDNSIVYNDVASYTLQEKISVKETNDKFYAAFTDRSHLSVAILDNQGKTVESETLTVKKENEAIKDTEYSHASYWFGNNFLYWGYQKVKSEDSGKRKVFFISKVNYEK